jgi:hypothetical protein
MKGKTLALAAIIVLVVLVLLYAVLRRPIWGNLDYWRAHLLENADEIYARSAGGYDSAAALALRRSEGGGAPTSADHLRAATIIHRNIIAQEHRPRLGVDGEPTDEAREVSQLRNEMFGRAREHYREALAGLTDQTIRDDEVRRANRRFGLPRPPAPEGGDGEGPGAGDGAPPPPGGPEGPGAEFIIEAALQFAFGGLDTLLQNDPLLAVLFAEQMREGGFDLLIIPDADLVGAAENRRAASIQTRRAAAAEAAEGRGRERRARAFLDLSQRNTSDSQNSHDVSVNAAKRAVVERLRKDQPPLKDLPTLDAIAAAIRIDSDALSRDPASGKARAGRTERALAVVDRAKHGERSAAAAADDEEVLRRVWARSDHPSNRARQGLLRQAVYDALVDCWERGIQGDRVQCVDGRVGRLIASLTLLDFDERTWCMKRLEQHKNDVYAKTQQVIHAAAAEAAAQTGNPALRKVGQSYLAADAAELAALGPVDPAAEEAFVAATHTRIGRMIDEHVAALDQIALGTIPPHAMEGLKREACAALY